MGSRTRRSPCSQRRPPVLSLPRGCRCGIHGLDQLPAAQLWSDGCFGTVSDGLDGTVPGAEKAQKAQIRAAEVSLSVVGCRWVSLGVVGCRWVSLGVTWGASSGALDMGITSQSHIWDVIPLDIAAGQPPPHFFRGAGIAPGGPGRLGHETRQGSLHVALKSVVVRPELADLNVIIQVEEWHSSDRFGGTVRARESGHLGPESVVRRR